MDATDQGGAAITIDKVAWVYIVDGRVLCARSHGKELYYLPGGKRDPGESDAACVSREVAEELGVELERDTLVHLATFEGPADGKPAGTRMRMTCYSSGHRGDIAPRAEIAELTWLGADDLARTSAMGRIVLEWLRARGLIR